MGPLLLGGLLGGAGLAKNLLVDQPAAARQRQLQATIAAYSPWTGMSPQAVQDPNAIGDVMQGMMSGAQLGQALEMADAQKQLMGSMQQMYSPSPQVGEMGATLPWLSMENKLQPQQMMSMAQPWELMR